MARRFDVERVGDVWASDLTYRWTAEGWLYLAVVLDLCSRLDVGWSLGKALDTELPMRARPSPWLLADGHLPACITYRPLLQEHRIDCSMSWRGECWDNAPSSALGTRAEARADVFDYIEVFYNRTRRHSALGYLSPAAFEQQRSAA